MDNLQIPARHALTVRPAPELHGILKEAASCLGVSVNSLILEAAGARAREILDSQRVLRLSRADADKLFESLENPRQPNAALIEAARVYGELIIE